MTDNKTLWNEAGKAGLVLGGVSIAYMVVNFLWFSDPGKTSAAGSILSTVLWAFKLWLCLWLLKVFMKKYSVLCPDAGNSDTFRFGMATALLSALLYSGGYLAWVTMVQPEMFSDLVYTLEDSMESMMTEEMIDRMDEMIPQMPTVTFFANLFWCWIFGTCVSAIYSRNIPSRNPFDNSRQN